MAILLALLALVIACEGPVGSPRPSPSLIELEFTPRPSVAATVTPSTGPTASRPPSWPAGWDTAFCATFAEVQVAQELLVDVERALDEDETRDARGLARELGTTAAAATALIASMPAWTDGATALTGMGTLMELGAGAAAEYETYFADDARAALRRARNLGRDNGRAVPAANAALDDLAAAGVSCPGTVLVLEAP